MDTDWSSLQPSIGGQIIKMDIGGIGFGYGTVQCPLKSMEGLVGSMDLQEAFTARLKARFGLDTRLAPVQARPAATDERPAVLFCI